MRAAIVPALAVPPRIIQNTPPSPRAARSLPLPPLISRHESSTVYGLATVDSHGRLADRALLRALSWAAGQSLRIRAVDGPLLIHPDDSGPDRVTTQGHLRLPARIRHACRLEPGDRVLLVADPSHDRLVVHPPAGLDTMITSRHHELWGGDPA